MTILVSTNGYLGYPADYEEALDQISGDQASMLAGEITPASLAGVSLLFLVLPTAPLTAAELSVIADFVNGGGRLVMLGDNSGFDSTGNSYIDSVLTFLGAGIDMAAGTSVSSNVLLTSDPFNDGLSPFSISAPSALTVTGDAVALATADGLPVAAYQLVGSGAVFVFSDVNLLNSASPAASTAYLERAADYDFASTSSIEGTPGDDYLPGTAGDDTINAYEGNDAVDGFEGDDVIDGGADHDLLNGQQGSDQISGGDGDDLIRPGTGDDHVDGGDGIDRVSYASVGGDLLGGGVTVDLNLQGSAQDTGAGGFDTLVGIEHVTGTALDDVITGDGGDNWLWGGSDTLGTSGNDTISGGDGNDLIEVGSGTHTLDGGAGTDTLMAYGNGSDIGPDGVTISLALQGASQDTEQGGWTLSGVENLSGSIYDDNLTGDGGGNELAGDAGNDILAGDGGNDWLYGDGQIGVDSHGLGLSGPIALTSDTNAGGNDTLEGGEGDDYLDGGMGSDTASYANAGGQVFVELYGGAFGEAFGADGYDQLYFIENLTGSAFDDSLTGDDQDNLLDGGAGHDILRGNAGNDSLYGGTGDDYLSGSTGDDLLDGGDGFDRVSYFAGSTGGVTVDLNIQGVSQDTGLGNDTLAGIEHVSGTAFDDTLTGNSGDNWLWGTSDGTGSDVIDGQDGNDLIENGVGDHNLSGGSGTDTFGFVVTETGSGINVTLGLQGVTQDTGVGMMTLSGFENLSGSIHSDVLNGDDHDNVLAGSEGSDAMAGGAGNDAIYGDGAIHADTHGTGGSGPITLTTDLGVAGDDSLEGGLGDDLLDGGAGTDTAHYVNASGAVQVTLFNNLSGDGEAFGADGNDTLLGIENVTGSAFGDTIFGSSAGNLLSGNDGNDFLQACGGDDTVHGGTGNDYLGGGTGNDYLDGGDGYDRASFSNGATGPVTVDLRLQGSAQDTGLGIDTLVNIEHVTGSAFGDTLTGDDGDNWLWGATDGAGFSDTIDGQGGNDLIEVGAGDHVVSGGNGTDTLLYNPFAAGSVGGNISLAIQGAAQDTGPGMMTLTGIENLVGSSFDDALTGDDDANMLGGSEGNDSLYGGAGNDTLYGDGWMGTDGSPSGAITIYPDVTAIGGIDGNDTLEGGLGDDQIHGGGGNDTASYANAGGGVTAQLYGGGFGEAFGADGYDQLHDIENLTGSAFNDQLSGGDDANVLTGGDGHDALRGFGGDDSLAGGGGDDFLNGGLGNDTLGGGDGYDRASFFADATAGVTVDLGIAGPQDTGQGLDTLIGIENLSGTLFADTLIGDAGDNVLWGSAATQLDGTISAANNDTLIGGDGNDLLIAGIGNHQLTGGNGNDTVGFTENGAAEPGLTISLELQGVAQETGAGSWVLNGIENLSGGLAADSLTGDGSANVLAGYAGNDHLAGGAGNDTLYGDGQIDWDTHGTGGSGPITTTADTGAGGNDVLEGGEGDDLLYGGGGNDTASYASATGGVEALLYNGGFGEAFGAAGYDQLHDIENLTGSAYDDGLVGNNEDNRIDGGAGNDFLRGNAGNDSLHGGDGDDYLSGSVGDDLLDGGNGWDRVSYFAGATSGVVVDLRIAGAQDTGLGIDTLVNVEHLSATAFDDALTGNSGDNWLWGGSDGTGNDVIDGQGGNDLIENGAGDHILSGGLGTDTFGYVLTETSGGITVSLAAQGAAQDTGVGMMTLTGFENLAGSQFGDALTGDDGDNVLAGAEGDDTLAGGAGNDTLHGDGDIAVDTHGAGGSGPISIYGDVADLGGASGNDLIEGGLGDDFINGGGGLDTATYAHAAGGVEVHLGFGFAAGADGDDTLVGIENVIGSEFDDSLNGSGGANILNGLGGNDFMAGGSGDDVLDGGDGDDFLQGDFGDNNIIAAGNDIVNGGNGNDLLRGGLGNDQLYGAANNDLLRGNGGVDYFDGGSDDGEGFNGIGDRISFYELRATQGVVADLRTGVISNDGFGNVEAMVGIESLGADTAYADTFYGNDERNALFGNRGDSLYGFGGDDQIQLSSATAITDGGSGTDRLVLTATGGWLLVDANGDGLAETAADATAGWTVDLAAGTLLDGYGNSGSVAGIEIVDGTIYADSLTGDANANVLNGGDGDDLLNGREGDDTLDGGNGNDTASYALAAGEVQVELYDGGLGEAFGADGYDLLLNVENLAGSSFNDVLIGNSQANLIQGGGGQDFLVGRDGDDTIEGGGEDDYLRGDEGNDILRGGSGLDRVSYATALGGVTVNLSVTGPQATGQGNDTLESIEHVSGTQFNDTITGNGADNWLWGGSNGAGVTGDDVISGGGGDDLIEVGAGNHTLAGGIGADTLSFRGNGSDISAAGVTYSLANQGRSQNTEQGMMHTSGFENVSGSNHDDALTGNSGANVLAGDLGNDMLRGEDGNDILYGDGRIGIDTQGTGLSGAIATWTDVSGLSGEGGGNDILLGGRGDDFLFGGRGDDTMTGNQGSDRYVIEADSGDDRITDFAAGIDVIRFDGVAGVDDFADLTITKSGSNTLISWGTEDSILLIGVKTTQLDASSFEFGGAAAFAAAADLGDGKDSFGLDQLGIEETLAIHSSLAIV